jgi:nitrite reductase/ring-hydroxylating ferredoxin subunit
LLPNREQITVAPDGKPPERQPRWRQDFPIDWPEDHYVARRDFTKFMVLTSFAFVVGQAWIFAQNIMRQGRGKPPMRPIAPLNKLAIGQSLSFEYPDEHDSCILVRTGENHFVAFSQKCTHLSCAVVPEPEKKRFFCPCHNGSFDIETGTPLAGPPRRPLPRIQLQIVNDMIYAAGLERNTI